jgi:hypothetical protein
MTTDTWDDNNIQYWKDFTFVDTSLMKGSNIKNKFFICYKKAQVNVCIENIKKYVKVKLDNLKLTIKLDNNNSIYGDISKYDSEQKPLNNSEMKVSLEKLLNKLSTHKIKYT